MPLAVKSIYLAKYLLDLSCKNATVSVACFMR